MGNLTSCCTAGDKQDDEQTEREGLLNNEVAVDGDINAERTQVNGNLVDPVRNGYGSVSEPSNNLPNAWNSTMIKMANNVIDVSSIEANTSAMEPNEINERQKSYAARINASKVSSILRNERLKSQTKVDTGGKTSPFNNLSIEPISSGDLLLINEFTEKTLEAIRTGFVVDVKEDLVVQFNP